MPKGLGWGYFFPGVAMPSVPSIKRAVAFIDGQNLFHGAREAFGYPYPNYDATALATRICQQEAWQLVQVRFYTGIPEPNDNPFWHTFWSRKLAVMGRQGVHVFARPLRYRNQVIKLPNGPIHSILVGEEKGVDVRIALDIVRMAHRGDYDVALVFSQDQDLSEVAEEVRTIAKEQDRWLKIACAYPVSPASRNRRGINKTDWISIDRATYDSCLDLRDYRPTKKSPPISA